MPLFFGNSLDLTVVSIFHAYNLSELTNVRNNVKSV